MTAETGKLLDRLEVGLPNLSNQVGLLSGGQRQAVAVARAAAFASNVVILDEPTAALGVRESRRVLDLIGRLREANYAVIVISHALDHVIDIADRAVVLRRGRKVGSAYERVSGRHHAREAVLSGFTMVVAEEAPET